jgi:hypothetical protein
MVRLMIFNISQSNDLYLKNIYNNFNRTQRHPTLYFQKDRAAQLRQVSNLIHLLSTVYIPSSNLVKIQYYLQTLS